MSHQIIKGEQYICIKCGNIQTLNFESPVHIHQCLPSLEPPTDMLAYKGLCENCFASSHSDAENAKALHLINQIGIFSQNVSNISAEGFAQPDSQKKYYKYKQLARRLFAELNGRSGFAKVASSDVHFYKVATANDTK